MFCEYFSSLAGGANKYLRRWLQLGFWSIVWTSLLMFHPRARITSASLNNISLVMLFLRRFASFSTSEYPILMPLCLSGPLEVSFPNSCHAFAWWWWAVWSQVLVPMHPVEALWGVYKTKLEHT